MNPAINENISDKELIHRITSRDEISEVDLMKEFQISESFIRKYKKNNFASNHRTSLQRKKLLILEFSLSFLEERGSKQPLSLLRSVCIDAIPILRFINNYAKDESILISIKQVLKSKIVEAPTNAIERYRSKYTYLNDDTLAIATQDDPELLRELVDDKELRPSTRGDILEALARGARPEYYEFLKSKCDATAPHIREAAFIGLYEYFDSDPEKYALLDLFASKLESETAIGVKATLANLLEEMEAA